MPELRVEGLSDDVLDTLRTLAGTRGMSLGAWAAEVLRAEAAAYAALLDRFDATAAEGPRSPDSVSILRAMRGDPDFLLPSDSTDLLRITRDGGMDETLREARGNRAA